VARGGRTRPVTVVAGATVFLFLIAAVGVDGAAVAQVRHYRVVVARPADADAVTIEALARVSGELEAAGFDIRALPVSRNADARSTVESIGRDWDPVAAFAIFPGPPPAGGGATAEIWVSDRLAGRATVQRLLVDPRNANRSAAVLAVHAVELLKASLAELWEDDSTRRTKQTQPSAPPLATGSPASPPPVSPVLNERRSESGVAVKQPPSDRPSDQIAAQPLPSEPPPPKSPSSDRPSRAYVLDGFGVEAGGGVLAHMNGFAAGWTPMLKVSAGLPGGFAARLCVIGAGQTLQVSDVAGTARLRQQMAVLDIVASFRAWSRVQPVASVVAGAYRLAISGTGTPPDYSDRERTGWAFVAGVGGGIIVGLWDHLALTADVQALGFLPRPVVRLGDVEVGQTGTPAVLMTAGIVGLL
jgi:hypothetical protein